jgi:SAM-dependent methyltransferase
MEEHMYDDTYAVEDGHWWFLNLRKILAQSIHDRIIHPKDLAILDAGCGTGRNLVFYQAYGIVAGVDLSSVGLAYCRKRGIKNLARGDVCRMPFKEESFDVVNSTDVIYAIAADRGIDLLEETYRILKPGGHLFLNTAAMDMLYSDHDRAVMTQKRYYKSELVKLVEETRFELLEVRYWNSVLFLPVVAYRFGRRLLNSRKSDTRGDLRQPNGLLNWLLYRIMRIDWVIGGALPFGTSLFCIVKKPARTSSEPSRL